jgi:hypothetical protein
MVVNSSITAAALHMSGVWCALEVLQLLLLLWSLRIFIDQTAQAYHPLTVERNSACSEHGET